MPPLSIFRVRRRSNHEFVADDDAKGTLIERARARQSGRRVAKSTTGGCPCGGALLAYRRDASGFLHARDASPLLRAGAAVWVAPAGASNDETARAICARGIAEFRQSRCGPVWPRRRCRMEEAGRFGPIVAPARTRRSCASGMAPSLESRGTANARPR